MIYFNKKPLINLHRMEEGEKDRKSTKNKERDSRERTMKDTTTNAENSFYSFVTLRNDF